MTLSVLRQNPRFLLVVWADMGGAKQVRYQNKLRARADTAKEELGAKEKSAGENEWVRPHQFKQTPETQLGRQVGKCHWI